MFTSAVDVTVVLRRQRWHGLSLASSRSTTHSTNVTRRNDSALSNEGLSSQRTNRIHPSSDESSSWDKMADRWYLFFKVYISVEEKKINSLLSLFIWIFSSLDETLCTLQNRWLHRRFSKIKEAVFSVIHWRDIVNVNSSICWNGAFHFTCDESVNRTQSG